MAVLHFILYLQYIIIYIIYNSILTHVFSGQIKNDMECDVLALYRAIFSLGIQKEP